MSVVIVTPDHFLPYCEKEIKDDGTVAFGFMFPNIQTYIKFKKFP
jgi:hypothetical protein